MTAGCQMYFSLTVQHLYPSNSLYDELYVELKNVNDRQEERFEMTVSNTTVL